MIEIIEQRALRKYKISCNNCESVLMFDIRDELCDVFCKYFLEKVAELFPNATMGILLATFGTSIMH